jgi:hypothetical protein
METGTKFATIESTDWSGFVTYGDHFRYVSATYSLPSVNCTISPDGSEDSQWVGLDGYGSTTVELIGTYAQCSGGTPNYYVYYDMYPDQSVQLTGVNPGDSITLSVFYNSSDKEWSLTLHDNTTEAPPVAVTLPCPTNFTCENASAEVLSEGPSGDSSDTGLANYGTVGFTQIGITDTSGHHGNFLSRYWKNDKIFEYDSTGNEMQAPGTLEGSESGTGGGYGNQAFTDTALASS